jgi:hypothetical protein
VKFFENEPGIPSEIRGSHGCEDVDDGLLGYVIV